MSKELLKTEVFTQKNGKNLSNLLCSQQDISNFLNLKFLNTFKTHLYRVSQKKCPLVIENYPMDIFLGTPCM